MWPPLNFLLPDILSLNGALLKLYAWKFDFYLQLSECLVKAITGVQSSSAAAQLFQVVTAAPAKNGCNDQNYGGEYMLGVT